MSRCARNCADRRSVGSSSAVSQRRLLRRADHIVCRFRRNRPRSRAFGISGPISVIGHFAEPVAAARELEVPGPIWSTPANSRSRIRSARWRPCSMHFNGVLTTSPTATLHLVGRLTHAEIELATRHPAHAHIKLYGPLPYAEAEHFRVPRRVDPVPTGHRRAARKDLRISAVYGADTDGGLAELVESHGPHSALAAGATRGRARRGHARADRSRTATRWIDTRRCCWNRRSSGAADRSEVVPHANLTRPPSSPTLAAHRANSPSPMKQILMTNDRVILARVPRVTVEPGSLLVQTHFSLVSTGTELASLKAVLAQHDSGALGKAAELSSRAAFYLGKAINNPTKAAQRLKQIAASRVRQFTESARRPRRARQGPPRFSISDGAMSVRSQFEAHGARLRFTSNDSDAGYQVMGEAHRLGRTSRHRLKTIRAAGEQTLSNRIERRADRFDQGAISGAPYTLGILNSDQSAWVAQITLEPGPDRGGTAVRHEFRQTRSIWFSPMPAGAAARLISARSSCRLGRDRRRLPASETGQIGWNIGYSAAGEVVAVGAGVTGYQIGDLVACAGAGQANHAEFISVKQNLCVPVPRGYTTPSRVLRRPSDRSRCRGCAAPTRASARSSAWSGSD